MGASLVLEYAGELHIFVLRRRNGPITAKPHLTLDQSEGRKEKHRELGRIINRWRLSRIPKI